ncbi:MAG: SRPBCC family protein [Pseudomonadota bacterium]|nr:SRPBCC family protein [Pseudomonadota bacterium]
MALRGAARRRSRPSENAGGAVIVRSVTINRPREELYAFWRDFSNLSRFMENIESVTVQDDKRSHWVVKAPAGQTVEWDSVVVDEQAGRRIAWESAPGADVKNAGSVEFQDAPGGRGTEVHATIVYHPPMGPLGRVIAKLFQKEPGLQARRDLRRFKQLMETGEIATTEGAAAAPAARKIKQ